MYNTVLSSYNLEGQEARHMYTYCIFNYRKVKNGQNEHGVRSQNTDYL